MTRKLAVITGASSGIGRALARIYAEQGWDVLVTARREERLNALCEEIKLRFGVEAHYIACDLSDPKAPAAIEEKAISLGRSVDGLVNNAGYGVAGSFLSQDFETHKKFIQVMQMAPLELINRFLPRMRERRFGRILNIASIAGFLPGSPSATLYGPVKSFLIKFSQGLHLEERDMGIHVTALCPGFTRTEFAQAANFESMSKNTPDWVWMGADEVAREGFMSCEANRSVCVPGAPNKTASIALKILPDEWMMELIARRLEKLKL